MRTKHFSVRKRLGRHGTISRRAAEVMRLFGLDRQDLEQRAGECACELEIGPGQVCFITGPSGTGKTVLLRELYNSVAEEERLWLAEIPLERGVSVIDCIEGPLPEALRVLCRAGLSDVFAVLNSPGRLSEGQQYRYRLARAMVSGRRYIFADEFGCTLDRAGAGVLAFQIRQVMRESGKVFFAASCHEDLAAELDPDLIIRKDLAGRTEVIDPRKEQRVCSKEIT